jgi:hypothetical protein
VTPYAGADGNGDGVVNQADFEVWRGNFGKTLPGPGAGASALMAGENSSPSGAGLSAENVTVSGQSSSASTTPSYGILSLNQQPTQVTTAPTQVAAVGATESTPSTSGTTSPGTGTSVSSSSLLASFVANVSVSTDSASTSSSVVRSSTVDTASTNSDLLLLDQTWSDMGTSSFDHDDESLYDDPANDLVCTNDLALAAVLKEDDEWWNAI